MLSMLSLHPDRRRWPAPARGIQRQTGAPGGSGPAGRRANGGRMARQVKGRGRKAERVAKFGVISGVESILTLRMSKRVSVGKNAVKCVTARLTACRIFQLCAPFSRPGSPWCDWRFHQGAALENGTHKKPGALAGLIRELITGGAV